MNKSIIVFLSLLFTTFFISCNKESDVQSPKEVQLFVDNAIEEMETRGRLGRGRCFELVFPVSISLPDQSVVEVNSYDELKQVLREWIKANGGKDRPKVRPEFVFPINVITKDGETVTVNSQQELAELRKECRPDNNGNHGKPCFKLNFPISFTFPDGNVVEFATPKALADALKRWKKANPTSVTRPVMNFPISVTLEDGTVVTVNSKEELAALKEDCR